MKKLLLLPMLALLFVGMVSCEKDQLAPVDGQEEMIASRAVTLPFRAWFTTHPVMTGADENGTLTFEIPSEGISNILRQCTWYSDSQVFATILPPPWVQTGTSIFTAADGSQLIGAFGGTTGPQGNIPFVGTGTYEITSGTGRYEGATGSGTYSYATTLDVSSAQLEFVGTLTLK
ncbi:MAG: hypothetical protein KDD02_24325 [Phaeodactylibacter sp.]|nr:hypothetical protein [Phaeodactylibacter sp.]